jgi:hypothetical protein
MLQVEPKVNAFGQVRDNNAAVAATAAYCLDTLHGLLLR